MNHPRPDFLRPLFVAEEVTLADTADVWTNYGDPFALVMPQLFLGGYADEAMSLRLVQGRYKANGDWQSLHESLPLAITAATIADTIQTEAGFQFGRLQIKTTEVTVATIFVNGRSIS